MTDDTIIIAIGSSHNPRPRGSQGIWEFLDAPTPEPEALKLQKLQNPEPYLE